MKDEEVFDVGDNVETLGFAYLFFKFVWPVLLGLVAIVVALFLMHWFLHLVVATATPTYYAQ